MSWVVESISREGIKSTNLRWRYDKPASGDHVRWPDGTLGRIWTLSDTYSPEGCAQICENQGSAFLQDSGHHEISGGPFRIVKLADLQPTYELHYGEVWNWADNMAGAHQGVHFKIPRPVFIYKGEASCTPTT